MYRQIHQILVYVNSVFRSPDKIVLA